MSFAPEALSRDGFLGGRLQLFQPRRGYRAAIDPVLLAAFAPARPGERVLDLGCGAGTAALCLGVRVPGLDLHGLEVQASYADLARRNAAENGLNMSVHEGDLRDPPAALKALSFDHVLCNPPFHPAAASGAADPGRDRAHREGGAALDDWIAAGLRRLAPGGFLSLIHRAARLGGILSALEGRAGVTVLPLAAREGRPAARVLVRARKARGGALTLLPPLIVHAGSCHRSGDGYSERVRRVLTGAGDLL